MTAPTGDAAGPGTIAADLVFFENGNPDPQFDGKICGGQPSRAATDNDEIVRKCI